MNGDVDENVLSIFDIPEGEDADAPLLEYTNFARKETIRKSGGKVFGVWQASFAGACIASYSSYIEEGSIIELREVGKCSGGSTVVMCRSF